MNITENTDDNISLCNCTNDDNDMILKISPFFNNGNNTMCSFDNMLSIIFIIWFY